MNLLEALRQRILLGDGAMGTQLQLAGLEPGGCGEAWNVDAPERILAIQSAYVAAGSDCLITNTFGASRIMLERHGEERVEAINRAGVELARRAFAGRPGFVLGDIGPFGGLMEPYGDVTAERVREAFREQARALVEAGADAIVVETQTSLEELGLAIEAAREAGAAVVIGSMAYDEMQSGDDYKTMMGIGPEDAVAFLLERGADIAAFNCGTGIDMPQGARIAARYRAACDLPVMAQPNAGVPVLEGLEVVYKQTPEQMVVGLPALLAAGVNLVGGCCGSTPDHIRLFRQHLDAHQRPPAPQKC